MFDGLDEKMTGMNAVTVKAKASCEGIGLHSGKPVRVTVLPAPAGSGLLFRRADLLSNQSAEAQAAELERVTVQASPKAVSATTLGTIITNAAGISVATVEHLMAAFAGLGIDNAIVEVDGPEIPIMDGSSAPFVTMLLQAGLRQLSAPRRFLRLVKPVKVANGDSVLIAQPLEDTDALKLSLDVTVDYADAAIGRQQMSLDDAHSMFIQDIAVARTFCRLADVEAMHKAGLALGGSMDNAIVVDGADVLNEGGLRQADEFVAHKVLDLIGDLHLLAAPLAAKVTGIRPGHQLNTALGAAILDQDAVEEVTTDMIGVMSATSSLAGARIS